MEFEWNSVPFQVEGNLNQKDIEESFEDPFAIRLMPDSPRFAIQARYFNLGKSTASVGVFSVYRTNGKNIRIIHSRPFLPEEMFFYQRKVNQTLAQ